jgi:hypothetical protein
VDAMLYCSSKYVTVTSTDYAEGMENDLWFRIGVIALGALPAVMVILFLLYK